MNKRSFFTGRSYNWNPYAKRYRISSKPMNNYRRTRIAYGSHIRRRSAPHYRRPLILRPHKHYPHTASSRISRAFRNRKSFNQNARILKKKYNLNTSYEKKISTISVKFISDQTKTVGDSVYGRYSNELYTYDDLLQLPVKLESTSITNNNNSPTSLWCHGFEIKLMITNLAQSDVYIKMVICRDKYSVFPGFRKVKDTGNDGISITVIQPAAIAGFTMNKNMTNFFKDVDQDDIKNFGQIDPAIRTLQKINPFRYTVLWSKSIKMNRALSFTSNMNMTNLFKDYFPYKKELIYNFGQKNPVNDDLKFFIYTSVPEINTNSLQGNLCQIAGTINMCATSKYNTKVG